MFSIYSNVAEKLGYKNGQKDNSLWKLAAWKEKNTRLESKKTVKNFHILYESDVSIPTIKPDERKAYQASD